MVSSIQEKCMYVKCKYYSILYKDFGIRGRLCSQSSEDYQGSTVYTKDKDILHAFTRDQKRKYRAINQEKLN